MPATAIEEMLRAGFVPTTNEDWDLLDVAALEIFRPSRPINEDRLFVGRIPQIRSLLDVIYQAGTHAILFGERGVGKTSLANIINERIIGPVKFSTVLKVSCSPNDVFTSLWSNVYSEFDLDKQPVAETIRQNPQPFTIHKIAENIWAKHHERYLIILDEFDRIHDEETKVLMADTIKYFSDNPVGCTILIVGVGDSIEQLFGSHPSIQRCCVQIRMPRMSPYELKEVVTDRLPILHMVADNAVIDKMVQYSQGLPSYMHLLGLLSVRVAIQGHSQHINADHLDYAVSHALERSDESIKRDYYKAIQSTKPDNRYREALRACALAKKDQLGQFSASDVCEPYSEIMGKAMSVAHFARHLNAFCDSSRGPALIKLGRPKRFLYHFANPLLEPLVIMTAGQRGPEIP